MVAPNTRKHRNTKALNRLTTKTNPNKRPRKETALREEEKTESQLVTKNGKCPAQLQPIYTISTLSPAEDVDHADSRFSDIICIDFFTPYTAVLSETPLLRALLYTSM